MLKIRCQTHGFGNDIRKPANNLLGLRGSMPKAPQRFEVDAIQIAYLWNRRGDYKAREHAIRALRNRRSGAGKSIADCESIFDVGVTILKKVAKAVPASSSLKKLSAVEEKKIADKISSEVLETVSKSTPEMVDYAIGMLFWMPLMR